MKILSCREAGCESDYVAKGETEEDVIREAVHHSIEEHSKTQDDMSQRKEMIRALIRSS
jgi:predicted small metal-binding protein